jgi:anti-sigma factor RsiW
MKKKTVRCHEVLNHICEELDSKLTSARCKEIKHHLENCPNCTAYLDSLRKTVRFYASSPSPRVPEKARKQLLAVLKLKA